MPLLGPLCPLLTKQTRLLSWAWVQGPCGADTDCALCSSCCPQVSKVNGVTRCITRGTNATSAKRCCSQTFTVPKL